MSWLTCAKSVGCFFFFSAALLSTCLLFSIISSSTFSCWASTVLESRRKREDKGFIVLFLSKNKKSRIRLTRVTQVTKVFPKVTLKGRVFHPDSNDVHISSLRWIPNYQGLFNAWPIFWPFLALWTSGPIFMAAILWRMIKNCSMAKFYSKPFPVQKQPLKNL